jgi:hypothetical protein
MWECVAMFEKLRFYAKRRRVPARESEGLLNGRRIWNDGELNVAKVLVFYFVIQK